MEQLLSFLTNHLKACGQDTEKIQTFFLAQAPRPDEENTYARFALQTLSKLSEEDGYLLIAGCLNWLELYATPDMLNEIRSMRTRLPVRPGLRDYRTDADNMILILEQKQRGKCLCIGKAGGTNASPHDEIFVKDSSVSNDGGYRIEHRIHCKHCNAHYIVTEDTTYHYPIYSWS